MAGLSRYYPHEIYQHCSDLDNPNLFTQEEPMKIIYFCGVLIILLIASSHFNQWRE